MKASRLLSGRYFISQFRLGVSASLVFTFPTDYRPLVPRGDKTIVAFRFVNCCPDANHLKVVPAPGVLSCRGTRHLLCILLSPIFSMKQIIRRPFSTNFLIQKLPVRIKFINQCFLFASSPALNFFLSVNHIFDIG